MIKYCEMRQNFTTESSKGSLISPYDYLQVDISNDNRKVLNSKRKIVCDKNINVKRHIIEDTSGKNAILPLVRYKIDALGNAKVHGCIVNNENAIWKLENRLKLAEFMSFITEKDMKSEIKKQMKDNINVYSIFFYPI